MVETGLLLPLCRVASFASWWCIVIVAAYFLSLRWDCVIAFSSLGYMASTSVHCIVVKSVYDRFRRAKTISLRMHRRLLVIALQFIRRQVWREHAFRAMLCDAMAAVFDCVGVCGSSLCFVIVTTSLFPFHHQDPSIIARFPPSQQFLIEVGRIRSRFGSNTKSSRQSCSRHSSFKGQVLPSRYHNSDTT